MKKKALMVIIVQIAMVILVANSPRINQLALTEKEQPSYPSIITKGLPDGTNFTTQDLTSPSYTNITLSIDDNVIAGTVVDLSSRTTSSGVGVSSGVVDFIDYSLMPVESDAVIGTIYSNKYAIKVTIPQTVTIYGFLVDIVPTITEDIAFYIRTSLTGANLRAGVIPGCIGNAANHDNQPLHVSFDRCGGISPLTLSSGTDYYFILEPSESTSSTFFELQMSENNPDNMTLYEWSGGIFQEIFVDTNFYLVTQQEIIAENIPVNSSGEAAASWTASGSLEHSLIAWYEGSAFYTESFGSKLLTVISQDEIYNVTIADVVVEYSDEAKLYATVKENDGMPVNDKQVTFSFSEDTLSWSTLGTSSTNSSGEVVFRYNFTYLPDNYYIQAKVNVYSKDDASLVIIPETVVWQNIDLYGNYRNNLGYPEEVKITTTLFVCDNDGNPVANLDFDFWYYFEGNYEHIPHYYTTNASGYCKVTYAVDDLFIGTHSDTHFFHPAGYEEGYQGNSAYGQTIVEKGLLTATMDDCFAEWQEDITITVEITSIEEAVAGIEVQFAYYDAGSWQVLGYDITNSSGFATYSWQDLPLTTGSYPLRIQTTETAFFFALENSSNYLHVNRRDLILYIINDHEAKGNGETINIEYTSEIALTFYVVFDDGSPVPNMVILVKGKLMGEAFYEIMGYTTTNSSGYATFNDYKLLTIIDYEYACVAEIAETGGHEAAQLFFMINVMKCTPIITIADHIGEKGNNIELSALIQNSEGLALGNVSVQYLLNNHLYSTMTDHNGFARITVSPLLDVGQHPILCSVVSSERFASQNETASLTINKGTAVFTLKDAAVKEGGYLTIYASAKDALGRPISDLSVRLSFYGWSELVTTNHNGLIQYPIEVSGYSYGNYLMVLTFDGNEQWHDASTTGNLLVYQFDSNIELLTGAITKQYGQSILLKAQLTSEQQNPLEGRIVQFVICFDNGSTVLLGENNTLTDGTVQYVARLKVLPGDYEWSARYCGSSDYGPAMAVEFITIQKGETLLAGNNFEAIAESTSSFQITLYDQQAQKISFVDLSLLIWINDNWIFLDNFKTNALGQVTMTMQIPSSLGLHYLQIRFAGNDYYQSSYITLELTVIEAPPKIAPNIIAEVVYDEIFDHQFAPIEITITNAVPGASVLLYVFVDNELLESIIINNGFGIYYWSSPTVGLFNVTFIAAEDSVYLVATETIIVEVEQNIPPSIVSYYYTSFICEGEPFYFEVVLQDTSGIDSAYLLLNGTQYLLTQNNNTFSTTVYMLNEGVYSVELWAIDAQENYGTYRLDDLPVLERKTQLVMYQCNSSIVEQDALFTLEVYIFGENAIAEVWLLTNLSNYKMHFAYQIDYHRTVWTINLNFQDVGIFLLQVKIVEETNEEFINDISTLLTVIPTTPQIVSNSWVIDKEETMDYVSGNLTLDSYYAISMVEIWINGEQLTVVRIADNNYQYFGYVINSNKHTMLIRVSDIKGRLLEKELSLTQTINPNGNNLIFIIIAVIATIVFVGIGSFLTMKLFKKRENNEPDELVLPEVLTELDDFEDISTTQSHSIVQNTEQTSTVLGGATIVAANQTQETTVDGLFDLYEGLEATTHSESNEDESTNSETQKEKRIEKPAPIETETSVEIKSENPEKETLEQVKDYIEQVKNDGLIEYVNGKNGEKKSVGKETEPSQARTIDDLSSFSIEIDRRLLPKDEQDNLEEEEESLDMTNLDLRQIAEEIEQTFKQ